MYFNLPAKIHTVIDKYVQELLPSNILVRPLLFFLYLQFLLLLLQPPRIRRIFR